MKKKTVILSIVLAVGLLAAQVGAQQAPAGAPAGTTGLCNDGTYYSGANKKGACRGHKGVKEWYGAANSGTSAAATSAPASTQSTTENPSKTGNKTPAPGGGAGKVWLNTSTNVYHCPGTRYYGTTKAGEYMTEAEAQAKGARPDHNKACK